MRKLKITFNTLLLVLGCFAVSPTVWAVSPPPDGDYANFNTAEGQKALNSLTTGIWNVADGAYALWHNTDGSYNTAVGTAALLFNVGDQTTGEGLENTAVGVAALLFNSTGRANTAVGVLALENNNSGVNNTAIGTSALAGNQMGLSNTASGSFALAGNTIGSNNTATGGGALALNIDGNDNTADGNEALFFNDHGNDNVAVGSGALISNTSGTGNTATGRSALAGNQIGSFNTATGFNALINNTASANTAYGMQALFGNTSGSNNVAVGINALANNMDGSNNVAIGAGAGGTVTSGQNVVCIGSLAGSVHQSGDDDLYLNNPGVAVESNTVRVGTGDGVHTRMFLAGVRGVTTGQANAIPVMIDAAGQLGTASSSRRFKHDIKSMDEASDAILALKPVTFHYKSDKTNRAQFGLIAEEVASVNPDLVVRDDKGEIYTVRYDAVNAMLLNEFLKEHKKVQQQAREIQAQNETLSQLKKGMDSVVAQLREQESRIQKVSAQLELSKGATQTVVDRK